MASFLFMGKKSYSLFLKIWSCEAKNDDNDNDSPKFRSPPCGKKGEERIYIYIYRYKTFLTLFKLLPGVLMPRLQGAA